MGFFDWLSGDGTNVNSTSTGFSKPVNGRTVVVTRNCLDGTVEASYDTGDIEIFTEGENPEVGDIELLGSNGNRTGWDTRGRTQITISDSTVTLPSGTYTVRSGVTSTTIDWNWPESTFVCTKCKETKKTSQVAAKYNWGDEEKLTRNICSICHAEAMDKFYGLDRSVRTERTLYEKNDKS